MDTPQFTTRYVLAVAVAEMLWHLSVFCPSQKRYQRIRHIDGQNWGNCEDKIKQTFAERKADEER
jgi:hypothetical protein